MNNYQCKKCSAFIQSYNMPYIKGCNDKGLHKWTFIGEVGPNKYMCGKCGLEVKSWNNPNNDNCPSKGSHKWEQLWIVSNIPTFTIDK
jgi:DNA-directed RNA polymerase subunit RPC12/RpoP